MNFWFCETCGKRLTDQDLEAGKARDKKLKGVYCADCATGISTQEMAIVTEAQIHEAVKHHLAEPPPSIIEPAKVRRESVRRIEPALSGPVSRVHQKPAKAKNAAPLGWIAATALMGGLFVGMLLVRGSSTNTPKSSPALSTPATTVTAVAVAKPPSLPEKPLDAPVVPAAPAAPAAPVPTTALGTPILLERPSVSDVPPLPRATPVSVTAVDVAPPVPAKTVVVDDQPEVTKKADPIPAVSATPIVPAATKAPVVAAPAAPVVPANAVKTVHFRTGEDNYTGLVDVSITNTMQANYNRFNGVSVRSNTKAADAGYFWCVKAFASDPSETQVLLSFKQISIPKGSKLVGAQLSLTFDNYWSGTAVGRYLNLPWDPSGLEQHEFGWVNRTPKEKWSNATGGNAGGADGNVLPGLTIAFGAISDGPNTTRVVDLDVSVVKRWLDDPATNCGVLITGEKTGSRIKIHNSSDAKLETRPMLILKFQ